jgi:multidrug transporter EmrE-like cation transporter
MQQEMFKFAFFALIALAVALEVVGDVLFKKWAIDGRTALLLLGLGIYFVGTVFWAFSLRYEFLSKAISVFTVLNMIIIVVVGVLYFKEDLNLMNKIGIALGVVSVMLMEL